MKHLIFLIVSTIFFCQTNAQNVTGDSSKETSLIAKKILLIDVAQPFLFDKVGLGYGWKKSGREVFVYANYRYGRGAFPLLLHSFNDVIRARGICSFDCRDYRTDESNRFKRDGFDIGIQYKIHDNTPSVPYAKFVKTRQTPFYYGAWLELSYQSGETFSNPSSEVIDSHYLMDLKSGLLIGWSVGSTSSKVIYDIGLGLGYGKSFESVNTDIGPLRLAYKLNIQMGFKL
jgi:hypothetical protein